MRGIGENGVCEPVFALARVSASAVTGLDRSGRVLDVEQWVIQSVLGADSRDAVELELGAVAGADLT